ncbi:MAG: glycosyltransferase family A protein [Anditalea sp.]
MYYSIIIPAFQDTQRLVICLDALENQDFPKNEYEVIVVNNDPNEYIHLDSIYFDKLNLKVLEESHPGSYAARNTGIKFAKGKVLALTDSDCIPDIDWLSNAKIYLEKDINKDIGILAGDVPLFYKNPEKLSVAEIYEKYTGFTFESYVKEGTCGAGNWFSYKSVLEEFGGFNSKLKSNGDTELSGKISKKYKLIYAPEVIVRHPSRFKVSDIAYKYQRLLGGVYSRRYVGHEFKFFFHLLNFTFRRLKFLLKKILTISPKESSAIAIVTWHITLGGWQEYFSLIGGKATKR